MSVLYGQSEVHLVIFDTLSSLKHISFLVSMVSAQFHMPLTPTHLSSPLFFLSLSLLIHFILRIFQIAITTLLAIVNPLSLQAFTNFGIIFCLTQFIYLTFHWNHKHDGRKQTYALLIINNLTWRFSFSKYKWIIANVISE